MAESISSRIAFIGSGVMGAGRGAAAEIRSTSPDGTTSRALRLLHPGRFSAILTDAIDAAFRRSLELGDLLDEQVRALQKEDSEGLPLEGAQTDGAC